MSPRVMQGPAATTEAFLLSQLVPLLDELERSAAALDDACRLLRDVPPVDDVEALEAWVMERKLAAGRCGDQVGVAYRLAIRWHRPDRTGAAA